MLLDPGSLGLHSAIAAIIWKPSITAIAEPFLSARPKADGRWITLSEICLILYILRKPNSLIALLFIQNNSQFVIGDIDFSDPLLNFSFIKRSFHPSTMFRINHVPKLQREVRRHIFLYKFDLFKFVTFCHWWSRNFLFCKRESGVPRFFISYSVNIRAQLCPSIHFGQISRNTKVSFLPLKLSFLTHFKKCAWWQFLKNRKKFKITSMV